MDFGEEVNIVQEMEKAEKEIAKVEDVQTPEVKADEKVVEKVEEKPEEKQEVKVEKEKKGDVNVALRLARQEAKELKQALARKEHEDREKYSALEAKLKALENPVEKPSFEVDPANYLKSKVEEIEKVTNQVSQAEQAKQLEAQLGAVIQSSEAKIREEHPDYDESTTHLVTILSKNIELLGVSNKPQRDALVKQEIMKMAAIAIRSGREPAELFYEASKNMGFSGKKADVTKDTAKIENIEKGQQVSQSLGSGSRAESNLNLESLARMDDEEFDAIVSDPKRWKEIGRMMH